MNEPPQQDQAAAHSRGGIIALWAAITLLAVIFVPPGFVLGFILKTAGSGYSYFNTPHSALRIYFYLPDRLAHVCPQVGEFYKWEISVVWGGPTLAPAPPAPPLKLKFKPNP